MQIIATFTIATLTSILYFTIFWTLSIKFKKTWLADVAWATGFFVTYLVAYLINNSGGFKHNLILILLFFWGTRLAIYLLLKNINKEDFRYQKLKDKWSNNWAKKSYLMVFVPQALMLIVINSGAIISTYTSRTPQISWLDYIATTVWILGFLIESIADLQMFQFKSHSYNQNRIYTKGLWKYSRHPNYFGECLMWIAIFLLVLPLQFGIVGVISPIVITFFLLKVTGVTPVENKLKDNPEYAEYIQKTPVFLPNVRQIVKKFYR